MPIKRQTYRLDQIDDWQGPVQQSGPTRDAAAQRVRDRLAAMSPTERVLSELTERPPTPRAAFPLRENAQTSRPMPPMAGQMFLDAGLGALEALDQPPTGMPAGVPYTTPLRLLSASGAVPSALAARAYDASSRGSVMADAPVVDPLQPADKQSMFSTAIAQRGGGKGAQALGFVADLLTPDVTDAFTGGLLPLAAMAGGLKKVNTGRKLVNGLYSRLDEAASMIPTKGVPATGVLNWLKKAPEGISLEEVAYRKLPEWLESQGTKTVTPEMLAAHLKENPAPFPQVKTLGGPKPPKPPPLSPEDIEVRHIPSNYGNSWEAYDRRTGDMLLRRPADGYGVPQNYFPGLLPRVDEDEIRRQALELGQLDKTEDPTRFSRYQVPGGENYRETMLMSPETDAMRAGQHYTVPPPHQYGDPGLDVDRLLHTRSNERTLPTGEPGRFIEEVQSDWHQQGLKKGYGRGTTLADLDNRINREAEAKMRAGGFSDSEIARIDINMRADLLGLLEDRRLAQNQGFSGVPEAPFKENWPDLGLKQQLIEAANDPNAEWMGFTGGKRQADRYDLSKQVDEVRIIKADNGKYGVVVFQNSGGGTSHAVANKINLDINEVESLVGKDLAKKAEAQAAGEASYTGLDLQVGGEGMTAFYDQKLPKRLEKLVKPFGGTVEPGSVLADATKYTGLPDRSGVIPVPATEPAWLSRLTPEMKAAMRERGFPLMSLAGPVAAQGIPDDPNSETDDYARLALNMGSMAALGMAAKGIAGSVPNARSLAELAEGRIDGRTLSHLELAPASTDAMGNTLVSTRVPGGRDAIASSDPLSTGLLEVQRNPELLDKLAAKIRKYPQITAKEAARSSESIVESFIDTSRRNLEFLFKEMAPWRERSRQWYVGANKVSRLMAEEHGFSPDQSSAVIAILSPQKDWHQNAEMARRLIKNYREFSASDASFTSETFNHYIKTRTKSLESTIKESLKKKEDFTLEDAATLRMELQKELRDQQSLIDRPWSELSRPERASFLRAHDEFVNGQSYPVLFPEGDIAMAAARTKAGKPSKMAWQSYAQIEKALGVLDDGSIENISRSLGNEHKVRAFFNNINRPEYGRLIGERGASTVDTHQVAGSLLQPMGASSPAVKYAMGGASDAALGLSGSNPLYQEALSRMARGTEYLPREMQSITWEGLKGLFSPSQKRNADFTVRINKLWKEYKAGRLSLERVQDAVLNEAGGITAPEWSRRQ